MYIHDEISLFRIDWETVKGLIVWDILNGKIVEHIIEYSIMKYIRNNIFTSTNKYEINDGNVVNQFQL